MRLAGLLGRIEWLLPERPVPIVAAQRLAITRHLAAARTDVQLARRCCRVPPQATSRVAQRWIVREATRTPTR